MIRHGKDGQVLYDPSGSITSPSDLAAIAHIMSFKISLKTDKVPVTCLGDNNKVYVPGLPDISGQFSGFYAADELTLITASQSTTPGLLKLIPHGQNGEDDTFFLGLAYLDADIDTGVDGAPKMSSSFVAGGSWELPG